MKNASTVATTPTSHNQEALQEMQDFLRALESYPARFALDPTITFEQHCTNLIPAAKRSLPGSSGSPAARSRSFAGTPPSARSGRIRALKRR